ncbi:unnamed protein product, partial [Rotaria sp. Silwood1]
SVCELCQLAPNNVNTMAVGAIIASNLGFDQSKESNFSIVKLCSSKFDDKSYTNLLNVFINVNIRRSSIP